MARKFGFRSAKASEEKLAQVDYKNLPLLRKAVSDTGRMIPARITSEEAKYQRSLSCAIKRARQVALFPYVIR